LPVPSALTAPAVAGAIPAGQVLAEGSRLPVTPNVRFFLVFYPGHPGNWAPFRIEAGEGVPEDQVGNWLLPVLQREPVQPGMNLHRTKPKHADAHVCWDNAHLHIQRQGGIVLPDTLGYCVGVPCRDPLTGREGLFYMDVWSTPRPVRMGRRLKFKFDHQRYARWRLQLTLEGVLPEPDEDIVKDLRRSFEARIARREAQSDLPDAKRERLVQEAKARAEWVASAAVPAPEPMPAPKATRRRAT
jgi:hypothetical protein